MKSHSLKFLRIVVAVVLLLALTWLFVDFTGAAAVKLAWLAKIQLVPALLAVNVVAIAVLALLTIVFGRIYCSVIFICPLGITQDIVIWLRRIFSSKKNRRLGLYRFAPEHKAWRYGFLVLFLVLAVSGLVSLVPMSYAGILDPYSIFGRMAGQGIVPLWRAGVSAVAESQAANGNYIVAGEVPAALANFNIAVSVVAAISFIIVAIFALLTGRGYCNTVCPVGTMLGFLSRFSLLRPVIDKSKCNRCGSCGRKCKAKCIDTKAHVIDMSRCVVCLDCINNCSQGAISYSLRRKDDKEPTTAETHAEAVRKPDGSRRAFLLGATIVAGAAAASAADKVTDGGLAPIKAKKRHKEAAPALPAGAISLKHFRSHCTACQLCISECPNKVLRPGTSLDGFMQPVMVFTDGFCRIDCNRCSQVCPTGAFKKIAVEEKAAWKVGTAFVDHEICISAANGESCGNCQRHCPTGAISMVEAENGNMRPVVNESVCIGCGECEYHCPVGRAGQLTSNSAAIYVNGIEVHQKI